MFERFASSARAAVEDARYEAHRRGDRRIGSEHLLLAVLQDDALAQVVGVDAAAAREAADGLDRSALAAVGLDVGALPPPTATAPRRHLGLTSGAKGVLEQTLVRAKAEKARQITARHLMLALLDRPAPDPATAVLTALSVDRPAVRERLITGA